MRQRRVDGEVGDIKCGGVQCGFAAGGFVFGLKISSFGCPL